MTKAPMTPLGLAAPVGALGAGVAGTDLEPPARLRRIRYYSGLFRRSCHARLAIANWVSGLFPYFVSGAVRGRMIRRGLDEPRLEFVAKLAGKRAGNDAAGKVHQFVGQDGGGRQVVPRPRGVTGNRGDRRKWNGRRRCVSPHQKRQRKTSC